MDRLEEQHKQALGREDPPPGFAARVLARIAAAKHQELAAHWWCRFFVYPVWRVALAGGLACLILLGGMMLMGGVARRQRQEQERMRAEAAKNQLLLALHITSSELNRVRQVVVPNRGRP